MIRPKYPKQVAQVIAQLEREGHAAYVVGGALRDALLGREAHDFDVTTSALPEDMVRIFADYPVIETGLKHGTLTVLMDHYPIEVTTFRIDGEYRDARHPEGVTFTDRVEDDLARRDFTVNAMAYHETRGLVDAFGGREDLSARLIRAVGDPCARFSEDALRILRAFRFMSKLDFDIERGTLAAAHACREGLSKISAERITTELCGLFEGCAADKALAAMIEQDIFAAFAPDFNAKFASVGNLCRLPAVFEIRFADFLKNFDGGGECLIQKLKLSNASRARVRGLLKLREFPLRPLTEPCVRRFLAAAGQWREDAEEMLAAGEFFDLDREESNRALDMIRAVRERGDCLSVSALAVDGKALMAIGITGRAVGETLADLLDRVLDDPTLNQKNTLLSLAESVKERKL